MARFGFCGPSYALQSLNANAQVCRNWYPEFDPQKGKSAIILLPTPGLQIFAEDKVNAPVRGQFTAGGNGGRTFAVIGPKLWEVMPNGTLSNPVTGGNNNLATDSKPITMCSGPTQLLIVSAGTAYVLALGGASGSASGLTTLGIGGGAGPNGIIGTPLMCAYLDGFFIVLIKNSNQIQVSAPADATFWDPTQETAVSVFTDNVLSILQDHRRLWLFGPKQSVVYYDSGGVFPLDVDPSGYIETGIAAPNSAAQFDNTVAWLGMNNRGACIVWKAAGYTPERISNHAIETAIQSYSTFSDAIGYSYQEEGHEFYVLFFPTANKTWVYDAATNMWHERDHWNPALAQSSAHSSQNHTFNFNIHLVGDWNSGRIYQQSLNVYTDNGGPIRRVRRAPHLCSEQQWIFHHYLQIDVESGLGTIPPHPPLLDGFGNPRPAQAMLRWSNDGTKTWSNELIRDCGKVGDYKARVLWRRLGKARDRVYELVCTDPIPWRIADAYLAASPNYEVPKERYETDLSKVGL